jgi:hypothetical protein
MRLDRAVELGQVAERQGELEVRIHMLRIACEHAACVGHSKLEQAALVVLLRTEGGFHQRRPGGERIAASVLARVRPSSAATRKGLLVTRFRLADPMDVQRLGPDHDQGESNARFRRNGSSKCRRPTKAVAWLPH